VSVPRRVAVEHISRILAAASRPPHTTRSHPLTLENASAFPRSADAPPGAPRPRINRRSFGRCAFVALLVAVGCIDTALSLVVELEGATVHVRDEGAGEVLRTDLTVFVRVGKRALAGDDFILPEAQLFVGETPVAEINLERPEGFDGTLEPGDSTTVQITGSVSTAAYPEARSQLCGADAVTALVLWTAEPQPDDPLDPPNRQMGTATVDTSDIRCE